MPWRNIFYVNISSCVQHVQKHLKKSAHWKLILILLIHEYRPSGGQSPLLLASSCFRAWTRQIIGSHLLIWYNFEIYISYMQKMQKMQMMQTKRLNRVLSDLCRSQFKVFHVQNKAKFYSVIQSSNKLSSFSKSLAGWISLCHGFFSWLIFHS